MTTQPKTPKILPSSCSSSHPEIRYRGAKCPLCEAKAEVARKSVAGWANAMCRDGHEAIAYVSVGEADCPLCFALWRINGPDGYASRDCDCYRTHDEYCNLSRPSSDPGAKPSVLKCPKVQHTGTGYLHADDDDRPYDVDGVEYCGRCHRGTINGICMNHPGAGEVGK